MAQDFGGQRVKYTDPETGTALMGRVQDRMPGAHGYTGVLFDNGKFEFVEDYDIEYVS